MLPPGYAVASRARAGGPPFGRVPSLRSEPSSLRPQEIVELRHPARSAHEPWLYSSYERNKAAAATAAAFGLCFLAILLAGVCALAVVPTADAALEDLPEALAAGGARCVRVARRADYTIAFVSVGSPAQYLKLLLLVGEVATDAGEPAMALFSERMHKSQTMVCRPFDPPKMYEEDCQDVAMIFDGTDDQVHVHTRFSYRNRVVAESLSDRAELLRLDGSLALLRGRTHWLTSTHFCWADRDPGGEARPLDLPFYYNTTTGAAIVGLNALSGHERFEEAPAARARAAPDCDLLVDDEEVAVRLFPGEAAEETEHWLALTTTFLYEYGQSILERRREVVEIGPACAEARAELSRANDVYHLDCVVHYPSTCRSEPSLPFRRVARDRLRIDIDGDGVALLHTESTRALTRIPHLLSYSEGLWQALGRLLVMVLTAAVVFVRGNQNASSSMYMLERALNTVRCRDAESDGLRNGLRKLLRRGRAKTQPREAAPVTSDSIDVSLEHTKTEVLIDGLITLTALGSRIAVLAANWLDFVSDGVGHVTVFEVLGVVASLSHVLLRAGAFEIDLEHESPLTKLAGPMSICDVSSAVLMVFADPPLLTTHDGRFAAVGRLLIAILISISVFSRCIFAVAICALLASSARNSSTIYDALGLGRCGFRYQSVLVTSALLWTLQAVACCSTLCILFVQPAAYSMVRMQTGDTTPLRYCLFFGLFSAALPTITKVALRVLESECDAERAPKRHAE